MEKEKLTCRFMLIKNGNYQACGNSASWQTSCGALLCNSCAIQAMDRGITVIPISLRYGTSPASPEPKQNELLEVSPA